VATKRNREKVPKAEEGAIGQQSRIAMLQVPCSCSMSMFMLQSMSLFLSVIEITDLGLLGEWSRACEERERLAPDPLKSL